MLKRIASLFARSEPAKPRVFSPPPCNHKWYGGFGVYAENGQYDTESKRWSIDLIKPYVCIHCKERKNELLGEKGGYSKDIKKADESCVSILESLPDYRDKIDIEKEIADMQLVDRAYIEKAMELFPDKFPEPDVSTDK